MTSFTPHASPRLQRRHLLSFALATPVVAGLGVATAGTAWAGANNTETAFDFFANLGLTRSQSAGLVGNFIVESGADPINPAAVQGGGGPGRGIAQWEGTRRTQLYNYAAQRGLSWSSLRLQLDFVWWELRNTETRAYDKIRTATTPETAAVIVRQYYERPSVAADERRKTAARSVYTRYQGNVGGSTPAPAETNYPTLRRGSSGSAVTTLQYLLRATGRSLSIDGSFGPGTESAVISFQRAKGLEVDGIVGGKTWAALAPVLKYGASGYAVRGLQVELRAAGQSISVDGSFGPATKTAVIRVQAANGLVQDGICGQFTWGALID
ncbi:phage tail tip lysozyme [Aestuariimicrobium soli]|uniref:phage tail tip lysozyme n=1 Tax=Aestuariimicrobium soli TaxID=2035834 RepID=UPI003EB6B9E2